MSFAMIRSINTPPSDLRPNMEKKRKKNVGIYNTLKCDVHSPSPTHLCMAMGGTGVV